MADLRYAWRQLRKNPGTTILVVLILSLGIGGTTAVFSVADKIFLNPIPGPRGARLAALYERNLLHRTRWQVSPPLIHELALHSDLFDSVTYFSKGAQLHKLRVGHETVPIRGAEVAPNFFQMLGIHPLAGRDFQRSEGAKGADQVIIIGYGLWQGALGGKAHLVDSVIELDGTPYTVVGIMPPNVEFPLGPTASQFWIPYQFTNAQLVEDWAREDRTWPVIVRLRKGLDEPKLQAALDAIIAKDRANAGPSNGHWRLYARPVWTEFCNRSLPKTIWSLQWMIGALLVIACANVGNLLLARAVSRKGEFALRMAVGAGRVRIMRQLLVETLLLAAMAAGLGAFFAWAGIIGIRQFYLGHLPRIRVIGLDPGVLGITCLVAGVSGLLFGLFPAVLAARVNSNQALKEGTQQYTGGSFLRLAHDGFVVVQVCLGVVLLGGAVLLTRSTIKMLEVDPGADLNGLFHVQYSAGPYNREATKMNAYVQAAVARGVSVKEAWQEASRRKNRRWAAWHQLVLQKIHAIPGIEEAAGGSGGGSGGKCYVEGRTTPIQLNGVMIGIKGGNYFRTIGAQLILGRLLNTNDAVVGEQAVVINKPLAKECWPGENPIGKQIACPDTGIDRVVVGVIKPIRYSWLRPPRPLFYEPCGRAPLGYDPLHFVVRTKLDLNALQKALDRIGNALSPAVEVEYLKSEEKGRQESMAPTRVMMCLLITLSGLALLLSALGVYAVLAYAVTRRTREVGIRMAMGAGRKQVLNLFFWHGARLILNGMVLGAVAAFTLGQYAKSLLFGVTLADPWSACLVFLTLSLVGGAACWLPSRRAARLDPMEALRYE